jgi:hypothetical protein
MSTSILEPDRDLPTPTFLRRQVQTRSVFVVLGSEGRDSTEASGCDAKRNARKKYEGRSSETRIDDVETEEDANEYLERLKRRHEEGKTTRLSE